MFRNLLVLSLTLAVTAMSAFAAYVYVELPAPYKPGDLKTPEKGAPVFEATREAVFEALEEKPELNISYVAIITYKGVPITPDADEFMKEPPRGLDDGPSGEINYVKGTGWPIHDWWLDAEYHIYSVREFGAYGWLKAFYGNPFWDMTVTVSYDTGVGGGLYIPALNEIYLGGWGGFYADDWKAILTHEMAHSFRDEWVAYWDHFEEGMAQTMESAVQNVFYEEEGGYRELWHHSRQLYPVENYYEYFFNHNMSGLSCHMMDFSASFCDNIVYYRYAVAGMAWWKIYLQERFYFKDYNAYLYLWHIWNYPHHPNFYSLRAIALQVYNGGPIEGKDFVEWFGDQPIFDYDVPLGADMLLVVKDATFGWVIVEAYVFERTDEGGGAEVPLSEELVGFDINVIPLPDIIHHDLLTNEQGYVSF